METYTLTTEQVKLEVFRDLIDELREVRKTRGNTGDSDVLETLEIVFENCFQKTKASIENG